MKKQINNMEKITLTLNEILDLEAELNGLTDQNTGQVIFNGFLKLNLSISLKFDLKKLSSVLIETKKYVDEIRNELITKYGTTNEDGSVEVLTVIEENGVKKINDNYIKFSTEFAEFITTKTKEIEYPIITKEDLVKAGDTNDNYNILFKLIKE